MPVIFIHGVNNRKEDPGYEAQRLITARFLKKHLTGAKINGKTLGQFLPVFPYWGDLGISFAWKMQSLPVAGAEELGPAVEDNLRPLVASLYDAVADPASVTDAPLLKLAQHSFPRAIDLLAQLVLSSAAPEDAEAASDFVFQAQEYAAQFEDPKVLPPWLSKVKNDPQFIDALFGALQDQAQQVTGKPDTDALGLADAFSNVVSRLADMFKKATKEVATATLDRVGDYASTKLLAWSRASLNATLGRFTGDVFTYMDSRGQAGAAGPIPSLVLTDIIDAVDAQPDEPLVVIGHSLGGVIAYDLFSHFAPELKVDLFISIGSQVSHFEEMKLFKQRRLDVPGAGGAKMPKPANVFEWLNIYDPVDIFSYACEEVFEGVQDFDYDTKTYVMKAHGAYFEQARFYERLRIRINEL
ncbi:alpha/beta fold hydrolase [Pseudomonas sp. dw_612]|uniref:alpha/beta fold hydrolase n=1 Tax=Pseudomonas sp. dw_612 TaxID=2720080 RepID=UPI001BD5D169|nr:alpha/beta fold hydrolase [Pseudomonas sp. dw_612]